MSATPADCSPPTRGAPTYPGRPRPAADPDEISVLSLVNVVLRHRGLVLTVALLSVAALAFVTLTKPRTYLSTSQFVPKSRNAGSSLAGLAAQFGFRVPTAEAAESPDFYLDLLQTRHILGQAVETVFTFDSAGRRTGGTLVRLYGIGPGSAARRRDQAIDALRDNLDVEVNKTGVVVLSVRAEYPWLAEQINRRLLQLLDQFNLATRQSQAGAERRFTQKRLDEVRRDLRQAEDRLQLFFQRNRDYRNSPILLFEQERLAREVSRQQQIYSALSEAYEQAKIEEVRDTPVLTIVEPPQAPTLPEPRGLVKKGILALAVGMLLGVLLAFARDLLVRSREEYSNDFEEFTALRRAALDDLLHPWRPLRRLSRTG